MKYTNVEWTIDHLMQLIDNKSIDLRPPYQRNFIWSTKDQKLLIDSIRKGYPLPNFFILKENNKYEMVDGQQRAITIHKFVNNEFADSERRYYKDYSAIDFMKYRLNIVILENFDKSRNESKEDFFYLVNKRGIQLNPSEVNHAYHHDKDFMMLVNKLTEYQNLIELDIFSDKNILRMNDRSLVEELAAYMFRGITDKRNAVEDLFYMTISESEASEQYARFCKIIDIIHHLQEVKPINQTRYKQRNDFYTLFCFVDKNINNPYEIIKTQYKVLVFISDNEIISPSNDEYSEFKEYAINCVSQSNSKRARERRLYFFEELLSNTKGSITETQAQLLDFAKNELDITIQIVEVGNYLLPNL